MTTLLIADDQALVRVGLRKILENEPQTTVVGEAGNGQDAVAAARRLRPDVVLMDIRMPVLDGIEATRRIVRAQPSTRVLILTTFGLDDYVYDALRAGASGFMLKDAPPEEIAAAVRIVASGDALLAPAVTRAVIEEFTRIPVRAQPAVPPAVGELTPREREVLDLLIRGLSNPEICRELVISEATAKTHVAKILQKLGVRDRVQAVIYAYETGLISPSPLSGQVTAGVGETPGRERGIAAFRLPAGILTVYSGIDGALGGLMAADRQAEIAASVAALQDLGPGYDQALAEGLVERIGAEIDKRIAAEIDGRVTAEVDSRILTQLDRYAGCRHQRRRAKRMIRAERRTIRAERADRSGRQSIALALGSMLVALSVTAIVLKGSPGVAAIMLMALIWVIVGIINVAYATQKGPPPPAA